MKKLLILIILLLTGSAQAEGLHTYIDQNGIKVITNLGSSRSARGAGQVSGDAGREPDNYIPLIDRLSKQYGVNSDLVEAIVQVESNYDPLAISLKDCKGLMQLHPDTAKRFGVSDIFNPEENVKGGIKFLLHLMDKFPNNLDHVLAAYNAGENAVRRHKGIPPYRETVDYVKKVRALYNPITKAEAIERRRQMNRKILRVVDSSGKVLLTNIPAS